MLDFVTLLDGIHDILALNDFPEDGMVSVQMRLW